MQGLLLRLSRLDAHAENAVRVIGFFDRLITARADLNIVLRNTAALAECPVGVISASSGMSWRVDPNTEPIHCPVVPRDATRHRLDDGTIVWIARTGDAAPLDALLLERFAITVAVRLDHASVPQPQLGDPALVDLVLSQNAGIAERSRALHLLRLDPTASLRVLAGTDATAIGGPKARLGSAWAVLHTGPELELANGGRWGVGPCLPAIEAPRSWRVACSALRFAAPYKRVVSCDDLGCLVVLADCLDASDLVQQPDLAALDRLAAQPHGGDLLAMLDALCTTGSGRKAADSLHRHHSTMRPYLSRAETELGFSLATPTGRFRLRLALALHRLRDNPR